LANYIEPVVAQLQLSLSQFQSEAPKAVQILQGLAGPMAEAGAKVGADAGNATGKALATTLEAQGKAAAQAVFEEEVSAAAKAAAAASDEVNNAAKKMGSALSGGAQFGTTAFNNMQMAAMQAGVQLGPIPSAVNIITQATQGLKNAWDNLPNAVAKVGAAMTALGGVVTVVGALLVKAGQGVEENQAALENTIKDTGKSYDDYAGQIQHVIAAEAKHGESASTVLSVLNKLTLATQDPTQAMKEMVTVENVAADTHTSLAKAAQNVTLAEQGKGRLLAQLNIQTVSQTKVVKDLATAEKEHAAAVDALQKVQQSQADQAQISAARQGEAQIQAASAAKAHRDALYNLNQAEKDFATLAAGPAAKDVEAGYIAIANAAKTTRDAQQKVIDAQKALDDLAKGPSADTQAQAQENVGKATIGTQQAANALSDAQANLATLQASGTATARQLSDAQLAIQQAQYGVTDANRTLSDSQAALNKLQADSLPGSDAMKTAQNNLADAQLSLRQANLAQADAQQKQNDLFAASLPGSKQYEDALKKVQDAQDAVVQSQQGVISANVAAAQASVTAQKSAETLADAQKKEKDTADAVTAAQNQHNTAIAQLDARTKGAADAVGNTFTGKIKAAETELANFISMNGAQFGKWMVGIGPIMMTAGMVLESGLIPKVIAFSVTLLTEGIPAIIGFAGMLVTVGIPAVISFGAALLANPITLIVAGILLLALAVYEIVTHWSTVKKWILDFWDWLVGFVKKWGPDILAVLVPFIGIPLLIIQHWGAVSAFFSRIWDDIYGWFADGVTKVIGVAEGIIDWFVALPGKILGAVADAGSWLYDTGKNMIMGLVRGEIEIGEKVLGWFVDLPGKIWDAIGDASQWLINTGKNLIIGLWNGLVSMADWLVKQLTDLLKNIIPGPILSIFGIHSPSTLFAGYGRNLMEGLAQGIVGAQDTVRAAMTGITSTVQAPAFALAGGGFGAVGSIPAGGVIAPPLAGVGGAGGAINLSVYVSGLGILTPDGLAQTLIDPLRSVAQRTLGRSAGSVGLA
jgi:hypothetical protein